MTGDPPTLFQARRVCGYERGLIRTRTVHDRRSLPGVTDYVRTYVRTYPPGDQPTSFQLSVHVLDEARTLSKRYPNCVSAYGKC